MRVLGFFLLVGSVACASKAPVVMTTPTAPPVAVADATPPPPSRDPVADAIATAESAFAAGQAAAGQGHLTDARLAFDRAVDTLLTFPGGARSDSRLSAAVDDLIDRISALELTALSSGDGFTETASEPASIDTLLSLPTAEAEAAPAPEVATVVEVDLANTTHDIPIPLNDRVLRFVELFQGRLRSFLAEGLNRGAPYLPMILTVFREEGLPLDLAFVPLVESAFKPTAVSRASARGVWQFMRGTGRENGLQHDWYIDERADPEKATRAAARYLKTLYRIFGDWHLALASYNGGPGRMQRAIKRSGGQADFWALSAKNRLLPRETRDYVPMILAATIIARNPTRYGFEIAPVTPFMSDIVTFSRPVDLRRIAEWAGTSAEDIRALNPELRRWTTPLKDDEYQIRVPLGTMASVIEGYESTSPDDSASLQWYTVRKGESLLSIARRLRVSRNDLAEANYLRATARVAVGQRLVVPRAPSAALLARRGTGAEEPAVAAADAAPETIVYRVRKGDTLFAIARRHGVSIEDLRAWNGLKGSALGIGDRLTIRTGRQANGQ
ncbi:MAG: LysM peptidoglycan-binding domain-containing protein [Vicinamibacterales bacterium]